MSFAEVGARARREALHRLDDYQWRFAPRLWRHAWEPDFDRISASPAAEPRGFLTRERAEGLSTRDPDAAAVIVEAAERACAGRFGFFGYHEVALERPLDFSRDPLSGRHWPERHSKQVDYRLADVGDPKWIWELNRCQHLPLLAEAWLLSGDPRFAEQALDDLERWIGTQPPGRGIAWSNGFEAGLRAISFALCFDALRAFPGLEESRARAILVSLWQHARWIERDPATHSSANNHRIGELAGLATIALLAPELVESSRWLEEALSELGKECERQILPDGTGAEQAFGYHVFIVDLVALVVALLRVREIAVPQALTDALTRAGDAFHLQLGVDEPAPTYGDTDDGRAHRLDGLDLREAREAAATVGALLGHAGAKAVASRLDATAWWLAGEEGAERFAAAGTASGPGSSLLRDSGLAILRQNAAGLRVMMDLGPLGYLSLAAHGHADALQVTLVEGGEDLIVDPGVGSYFARPDRRKAFRSTRFHPTVTVDGRDQSEEGGPFLWLRHARARILELDLEAGLVAGEHDGYLALSDPVRHRRAVALLPEGALLVYDRLEAEGAHRHEQCWPLHPALEVVERPPRNLCVTRDGEPRLLIALAASHPGRIHLTRGRDQPPAGWWSPRLEAVVPAWRCVWEVEARGDVELGALLWPVADARWPDEIVRIETVGDGVRATFEDGGTNRERVLTLSREGTAVLRGAEQALPAEARR